MWMSGHGLGDFADFFHISDEFSSGKLHFSRNRTPAGIVCIGHPIKPLEMAMTKYFSIFYSKNEDNCYLRFFMRSDVRKAHFCSCQPHKIEKRKTT